MINSLLFLILTDLQCFQQTQKELHKIYPGILEQTKPLQLVGYYGQQAEFKFEYTFEPLPVIWQSLPKTALTSLSLAVGGRAACPCTNVIKLVQKFNEALTKPYHGLIEVLP